MDDDADADRATRYAKQLAESLHSKHYQETLQWEPLPDLMGLLTQIDNMVCGLVRPEREPQKRGT